MSTAYNSYCRGLTIAAVVHGATVTDSEGNDVDTTEFFGPTTPLEADVADDAEEAADEAVDATDEADESK